MNTIHDVARHAGVSASTVSNVLNGRTGQMRPETLERVRAAIAELKYGPSTVARQLKTGHSSFIGLLIPSIANPMFGYIACEIERHAQQHGYRVLICNAYRDPDKEAAFFQDLLAHGVRSAIVVSSLEDERHLELAVERGMTVVSYDRRAVPGDRPGVAHITVDSVLAAYTATRHLIEHGHRRLAFVTVSGTTMSRKDKIQGFWQAVDEAGLRADSRVVDAGPLHQYGDSAIGEIGAACARELSGRPDMPTGIVALNDLMALGVMAGLHESGLRVPQDVSVIGMDGLFLSAMSNPGLSTVEFPVAAMAAALVDRVIGGAAPDSRSAETIFTDIRLIERESVAAPRGRRGKSVLPPRAAGAAAQGK